MDTITTKTQNIHDVAFATYRATVTAADATYTIAIKAAMVAVDDARAKAEALYLATIANT